MKEVNAQEQNIPSNRRIDPVLMSGLLTAVLFEMSGLARYVREGIKNTIGALNQSGQWVPGTEIMPIWSKDSKGKPEIRYAVIRPEDRDYIEKENYK